MFLYKKLIRMIIFYYLVLDSILWLMYRKIDYSKKWGVIFLFIELVNWVEIFFCFLVNI